jgi:hypothetical protein
LFRCEFALFHNYYNLKLSLFYLLLNCIIFGGAYKVFEIENQQWTEIQKELQNVLSLSIEDILSYCIVWLESNRFQDSDKINMNHLASVYSLFVELIISHKSRKQIQIKNSDEFFEHFLKVFAITHQNEKLIDENTVAKLLFKLSNWVRFQETVVSPYCFDLNIEPKQENELIIFNSNPESYYKWILNGVRYEDVSSPKNNTV